MDAILKPRDTQETCDVVKWAAAEETPLEILGQRSKQALGRPVQAGHVLDLRDLSGVEVYEPAELVLTVKAGTPIAEVETLVSENAQELSFEPMDYGPLLGQSAGKGTVGGVLATNLSGPRRIKAGAARDHILGMEAVSGRGEIFNSGGRVVKNVTGYDLPRALCGSWGTLAVATTVTLKVNPKPEASATLVLSGLSDDHAVSVMCAAMGSSAEVSGAAHIPNGIEGGAAQTVLRLEGFAASVDYRFESLHKLLASSGSADRLDGADSLKLWRLVRDVTPFVGTNTPVWRISVAPTCGAALIASLKDQLDLDAYYDWSGGLVWVSCLDGGIHDDKVRKTIADLGGGHAMLVRADAPTRASTSVFQPQPAPLAALAKRLKHQFDPHGILNPGRMTV